MDRRALLAASCTALVAVSGCLSRQSSSPNISESTIEDCEVSYIEREVFDDEDPPSIDASVRSIEPYDDEYDEVEVESHWQTTGVQVLSIVVRPAESSPPKDAPSSSDDPFVEIDGYDLRIAVDAEHQLGKIVGADRKAVEEPREGVDLHHVVRYLAHHIDFKASVPAHEAVERHHGEHFLGLCR